MGAEKMKKEDKIDLKKALDEAIKDFPEGLASAEEIEKMKNAIYDAFSKGYYPLTALGFSKEMIDLMYRSGYEFYQAGNYEEAFKIFSALGNVDPSNFRASFGEALCMHKMGRYGEAILFYTISNLLSPFDSLVWYYMGHCYYELKDLNKTLECLENAVVTSKIEKKFEKVGERALLWYVKVEEELELKKSKEKEE